MHHLINQNIVLGITGGIAAYKSCDLIRKLKESGAQVRVVLTQAGEKFISPLTLQALSQNPVYTELFDPNAEAGMDHIQLAKWANVVLIAPASADFIARLTYGHANDLLSTVCLATSSPIILAPAMNQQMWQAPITQTNIKRLQARNIVILPTEEGLQACGDNGPGRLWAVESIVDYVNNFFLSSDLNSSAKSLEKLQVVITAGATQEPIDPVRYLTNASSGKMGYALAATFANAGAKVKLISAPTALPCPTGVNRIDVVHSESMYTQVMAALPSADIFISAAAVADYRAAEISAQKIKKTDDILVLSLVKNKDIVAAAAKKFPHLFVVGFAAETENLIKNATKKLQEKNLDMVIANEVSEHKGFNQEDNSCVVISRDDQQELSLMHKNQLAQKLLLLITEKYYAKYPNKNLKSEN